MSFFPHNAILLAKKLLYSELNTQGQVISHVKDDKNFIDMCKLLLSGAKEKKNIPHVVICNHCETLVVSNAVSATLATKVNGNF